MPHIVVAVGIGMGLVFSLGVMVGVMGMIAAAIRREDKSLTLTGRAPDAGARGVRRMTGLGLRDITSQAPQTPPAPPDDGIWS